MVRQHEPFRMVMKIGSPVILKSHPPSLDALLYAAMSAHWGSEVNVLEKMKDLLRWDAEGGFFHASSMRFVVTNKATLTAANAYRTDHIKNKLTSEMIAPNGQSDTYSRVVVEGGPYKTRMTQRNAYCAPYVMFDGNGDREQVTALLNYYLCGVGYDAQNNAQGEVIDIESFDMGIDTSISLNGQANRCIPVEHAHIKNITGQQGLNRIVPPYYQGDLVAVVMPDRVRTIHHLDIGKAI